MKLLGAIPRLYRLFNHSHILDKSITDTRLIYFVFYRHSWNNRTTAEAQVLIRITYQNEILKPYYSVKSPILDYIRLLYEAMNAEYPLGGFFCYFFFKSVSWKPALRLTIFTQMSGRCQYKTFFRDLIPIPILRFNCVCLLTCTGKNNKSVETPLTCDHPRKMQLQLRSALCLFGSNE